MSFMASLLEIHRQNLFVRKSVGELLFDGYRLDFLDSLRTLARPLEMFGIKFPIAQGFPNNRFAIYLNRNNTPHGPFEVYTGVGSRLSDWSSRKTAHIYKWKNKTKLDWYGGKCNMLHGTDGTRFAPFIGSSQELALLAPEACRVVKMQRVRSIREDDIPGYRYELGIEQFLKPQLNPDNWCYCKNRSRSINDEIDQCSMSGLIDLSKCWFGAPIYATKPHFYQIDPEFRNGSAPTDMRPNPLIHESFIHVEPVRHTKKIFFN